MVERVGVIGLGKMGQPITRHLVGGGFETSVFDLDAGRVQAAVALGAHGCADPAEVASRSDLVIVVVGFDDEVMEAATGASGLLKGAKPGMVVAVASTVAVGTMKALDAAAAPRGVKTLDIPLCRGEPAAEAGELLLIGGGEEETFERCRGAFETFASDCQLIGGLGAGQTGKMINNLLLWACICANHEGLKLGEAMGVDPEKLRQALLKSSGANWALETWLQPRTMPWAEKDMTIVLQEADNARVSLPLCGVVKEAIKGIKIEKGLPGPPGSGKK
jgi:3-hydroxyisobutyrate dehydrogenase-like beta-hydroxyacid dehydrogenase